MKRKGENADIPAVRLEDGETVEVLAELLEEGARTARRLRACIERSSEAVGRTEAMLNKNARRR
ncbi:MAG: hypothetical protein AB1742_08455 [bacterium]